MKFWALALVGALIYARNKEVSMNLHNEIMNIRQDDEKRENAINGDNDCYTIYNMGHRDARHAAAELSLKYGALIERLLDALEARNADDYVEAIRKEYSL